MYPAVAALRLVLLPTGAEATGLTSAFQPLDRFDFCPVELPAFMMMRLGRRVAGGAEQSYNVQCERLSGYEASSQFSVPTPDIDVRTSTDAPVKPGVLRGRCDCERVRQHEVEPEQSP